VVKFGDKKRYSDREHEAIYQELAEAGLKDEAWHDLDATEAVFKKLNAADGLRRLGAISAAEPSMLLRSVLKSRQDRW
jgi:hypothetical protein